MKINLSITLGELNMLVKMITRNWPIYKTRQGNSVEEIIESSNLIDVWLKFTKRITSNFSKKDNTKMSIKFTGNEYLALNSMFEKTGFYNLKKVTPETILAQRIYEESTNQLTKNNELMRTGILS